MSKKLPAATASFHEHAEQQRGVDLCPLCHGKSIVMDSRPRSKHVYRRRKCTRCLDIRWTTVEFIAQDLDVSGPIMDELARIELQIAKLRRRLSATSLVNANKYEHKGWI